MCDFHSASFSRTGEMAHEPGNSHSEAVKLAGWRENTMDRTRFIECEWDGLGEMPTFEELCRGGSDPAEACSKQRTAALTHYRKLKTVLATKGETCFDYFNRPMFRDVTRRLAAMLDDSESPLFEQLFATNDIGTFVALAKNSDTPLSMLAKLLVLDVTSVNRALAARPGLPPAVARVIAQRPDISPIDLLASPDADPELADIILARSKRANDFLSDYAPRVHVALARQRVLKPAWWRAIITGGELQPIRALASRVTVAMPLEDQLDIVRRLDRHGMGIVATHCQVSPETSRLLWRRAVKEYTPAAGGFWSSILESLASKSDDLQVLRAASRHKLMDVRRAVTKNEHAPTALLASMQAKDPTFAGRRWAQEALESRRINLLSYAKPIPSQLRVACQYRYCGELKVRVRYVGGSSSYTGTVFLPDGRMLAFKQNTLSPMSVPGPKGLSPISPAAFDRAAAFAIDTISYRFTRNADGILEGCEDETIANLVYNSVEMGRNPNENTYRISREPRGKITYVGN